MRISDWSSDVCSSDLLAANLVEGDVLRGVARRRGDRHRGKDLFGIARRPLQHLHAAHRAADDAEQLVDAEPVDQQLLRAHHVGDGDYRKVERPGLTRSEEHTSELQSLMRISYAVFCLKKKKRGKQSNTQNK